MIKDANDGLRQRYAEGTNGGLAGGNFGVKPLDCCQGPSMGPPSGSTMKDGERGAGMPVKHTSGKMPSQAMPDHGPHKMGAASGSKSL